MADKTVMDDVVRMTSLSFAIGMENDGDMGSVRVPVPLVASLLKLTKAAREHVKGCSGCAGSTQGYCGLATPLENVDNAGAKPA